MKRTTGRLLTMTLLAALPACERGKDAGPAGGAPPGGGRPFGVTFQTMNNPFFVELDRGLREVVEARGDRLVTLDAQFNSAKQKNDIADLIQQGATVIFINPVNWEGIRGSLLEARRKQVPCVIVDAPVEDESLVLSTVASDNVEAGRLAARALAAVRPSAKIVVLHHSVNKACIDRVAGFREELAAHPGMTVLDTQEGKGTTEGGRPVMRDLLGRYPEVNAVFAINDPSALGAISALESAGKLQDVAVVSVDGSEPAKAAIRKGKLLATAAQFPAEIGRLAAEEAYHHLDRKPVRKKVAVRVQLITRDNGDQAAKP